MMAQFLKLPIIHRSRPDDLPGITGRARLDRRTKNLTKRLGMGDIAIIDHVDLDKVSADALLRLQVAAVVNAAPSISGRYPNLGPQVLVEAGVPLVDNVGPEVFRTVNEGTQVRLHEGTLYIGDIAVAKGQVQTPESVAGAMAATKDGLAVQLQAFVANTLEYAKGEGGLLIDGISAPDLTTKIDGSTCWSWCAASTTARTWPRCAPTSASSSRSWWAWTAARTRCSRPGTGPTSSSATWTRSPTRD